MPTAVETTIADIAAVSSDIPTTSYYNYYSVTGTITLIGDAYYLVDGADNTKCLYQFEQGTSGGTEASYDINDGKITIGVTP